MKKSKLFGLALVAITASFSACSDLTEEMLKESEIKLTNEITPVSRVADLDYQSTQILAEQEVGVTITGAKSEHNNIKWTTGTDGALTNGGNPVYYSGNNAVTIIAYHPYNSTWTETSHIFSVNTNQSTNEGYLESDLLWASETSTKTEEAVALTFTHKLSKINVTLTSEDNANLSNATISICGTNISTSFNPSTGELSATTANVQEIKAGTTTSTASAIVIPQTVASGTKFIKVELSGKIFYYTLKADKELKSGYSHNYTLTVKEKEVEVGTESDKITDWEDDNNSGDAEEDSNNISTIKTVNNATAGKLATLLTQKEKETLTSLKITGNLNSDDIRFIREMAGGPINTSSTPSNGSLISLDISGCEIVEGGDYFFESNSTKYYTADKDLGEYAFAYTKLEYIELPTTITSLKHRVLAYTKIKELTIPNSVTNFNGSELFSTETLTTVHLPAYLNYHLVNGVFHNCPNLKTITIDDSNQYFTVANDGLLYVQWGNEYALYCCPAANTTATIDPKTEFIMYASFSYSKIESLVIPQNVKRIDTHVFKDCNLLQSIKVESATPPEAHRMVTNGTTGEEFAQTAFDLFSNINNCTLYVPKGSINAYKEALGWKSFTNIVEYDIENDNNPVSKTVNNVTAGGLASLLTETEKIALTSLKITGKLNSDDIRLIREMAGGQFEIPATPTSNSKLTSLDITDCQIVEGGNAFVSFDNTSIYTSENSLGSHTFAYTNLKEVYLPSSVVYLEHSMFMKTNLSKLIIPDNVEEIRGSLFYGNDALTSIDLPANLKSKHLGIISNCKNLETITIEDSNDLYQVIDGVLYLGEKLYYCPAAKTNITIKEGTTDFLYESFQYSKIAEITIPSSVTQIDWATFRYCENLTKIKMESSTPPVAHIISEDDEVWTAFMQFTNMEDCTLYVPNGSAETYRETLGWKDFTKIEEYE